jgi:hypothetical protein
MFSILNICFNIKHLCMCHAQWFYLCIVKLSEYLAIISIRSINGPVFETETYSFRLGSRLF